ncbi:MAG TPA: helix-turn-helix domain-containing protein [Bacillota bacterium]
MVNVGRLLRHWRQRSGLTQTQVAEGICSRAHLSDLERGVRLPTAEVLAGLADRLGIPVDDLVTAYLQAPVSYQQWLALARLMAVRGEFAPAQRVIDATAARIAAEPSADARDRYRAEHLETVAMLRFHQGSMEEALEAYQQALVERLRTPSRRYVLARAYYQVGTVALTLGRRELAGSALYEAFRIVQFLAPGNTPEARDRVIDLHRRIVQNLGVTLLVDRKVHQAWVVYRQADEIWRRYDMREAWFRSLSMNRALAEMGTGHLDEARDLLQQVLDDDDLSADDRIGALNNLGVMARLAGEWKKAETYQRQAWELHQRSGTGIPRAICNELARCALQRGDLAAAESWLTEADRAGSVPGDPSLEIDTIWLRARLHREAGEAGTAVALIDAVLQQDDVPVTLRRCLLLERLRVALAMGVTEDIASLLDTLEASLTQEAL